MISSDPEELLDDTPLFSLLQPPSVYTTEPTPSTSAPAQQPVNTINSAGHMKRNRVESITRSEKRAKFERTKFILANSGLLEIVEKTGLLIKANQDAQEELEDLRREIGEFVQSVLSNPANQNRSKQAMNNFLMNPLDSKPPAQLQQQTTAMQQPAAMPQQHRNLHQSFIDDNMAASPKVSVIKQHTSSQASVLAPGYMNEPM